MAYVSRDTNIWMNPDNLTVHFGVKEALVTRAGGFGDTSADGKHTVEFVIDLTALPTVASGNIQIQDDTILIPKNAVIDSVSLFLEKESAGTNANLNLGLVRTDRTTEIDNDGLLASSDNFVSGGGTDLGYYNVFRRLDGSLTTEGGVLLGKSIGSNAGLVVAWADTADFTGGVVRIQIQYHISLTADV